MSTANLEVKLKAPNGTNLTVKGKQGFDNVTTGSVRSLYTYGEISMADADFAD